jgi:hypothetical protein
MSIHSQQLSQLVLDSAAGCAGGIGAFGDAAPNGLPFVLGRLSARQIAPVKTSEPHIVVGWHLAKDGRKMTAGSALFTAIAKQLASRAPPGSVS